MQTAEPQDPDVKEQRPLHIGYLVQNKFERPFLDPATAPCIHAAAVIKYLLRRGHRVRFVLNQEGAISWTDEFADGFPQNLQAVRREDYRFSYRPWFRAIERPLRRLQTVLRLPYGGFFDNLRFSDAYATILAGYDLIYERYMYMAYGGVLAARRMRVPHVLEVNGDLIREMPMFGTPRHSRVQGLILHELVRFTYHAADRIVTVSESIRGSLQQHWQLRGEDIVVVPNGVDLDLFTETGDPETLRARYGLGTSPVVLFVGNFAPWHGLDVLLQSFQLVRQSRPDAYLILVGDGVLRSTTEAQIQELGLDRTVILTGRIPRKMVLSWLSLADVAVAPWNAFPGGTPLKLFEYMASGRAIVAAAVAGIERFIQDGKTAFLVPPGDTTALARALLDLLRDGALRQRLGAAARQKAAHHSWAQRVSEIEALLYQLVEEKRVPHP